MSFLKASNSLQCVVVALTIILASGCAPLMESMKEDRERYKRTKEYIKKHGDYATVYVGDVPMGVYAPVALSEKIKLGASLVLSPQYRNANGQWLRSRPTWRLTKEGIVAVTRTMDGLILVRGISKGETQISFRDPEVDAQYPDLGPWMQAVRIYVE